MGLITWLKGEAQKLIGKTDVENALKLYTAQSDAMTEAIGLWSAMYQDHPPWQDRHTQTLNLPAVIAAKIAKLVTIESQCNISGSARADWIKAQMKPVWGNVRNLTELAAAKGGMVFKPYIDGENIIVDCIQADSFFPTDFDSNKNMAGGVFVAQKVIGKTIYTRLEQHKYKDGTHTITQYAYRSNVAGILGTPCSLEAVPEWADIEPIVQLQNIKAPLFVYWGMPFANNIDVTSPLGVSIYSRAADTIKQLDLQYSRLIWEFEGGEMAIHASADLFKHKPGKREVELPKGKDRLYRLMDVGEKGESVFSVYAPTFRDSALLNGFNALLRQIEQQCGLAFGTLSDPQSVDKTATEVIQSKQESYSTVADIQKSLQGALEALATSIDALATAAHLAPSGRYEITFDWDDSIIVDKDARRQQYWQYVTAGKFPMWKFLTEFEGYTEEEAKAIVNDAAETVPRLFEDE